jgi:anaerobic selenocysteine-containing dehydrogenase
LRVLYPIKRSGDRGAKNAAWERISWDEALDLVSTKIAEAIEKYGTYAFFTVTGGGGSYAGTQARTLDLMLGSPTCIAPGSQNCHMPRVIGASLMYGGADQSIADCKVLEPFKGLSPHEAVKGVTQDTKVFVLWGAQPSTSQVAQSGRGMAELRARGCKTVVVDPYMSPDAAKATIWLRVRPGTDCAMILSWINYVIENNLIDADFCKQWTNLPFIIDPDTKLPYYAKELFPDFVQSTPANTPAYVCWDNKTQSLQPFEYASENVDPEIFWSGEVNGKQCRSAGQVYKEAAEKYTLEKASEICWVPADLIEKAIRLYADAPIAGIAHGVATDQQQISSQAPIGLMGLDMMMGYVNKPGAALTQNASSTPKGPPARPTYRTTGPNGLVTETWGVGYIIGASEEENAARIANMPLGMDAKAQGSLYMFNQMAIDILGSSSHKGLISYVNTHPPATLYAILNGIPYKPRALYSLTGNPLAMFPNAAAWCDAFYELDFCCGQSPMLTSFHMETADLVLPLKEWLEQTMQRNQLNYNFPATQVVHLGETISSTVAPQKVLNATAEKLNAYLDAGNEIVFGAIGAAAGKYPAEVNEDDERSVDKNSSTIYECDKSQYEVRFPLGGSVVYGGVQEDSIELEKVAARFGAPDYETLLSDLKYQQPDLDNPTDPTFVTDPQVYWCYDQHLQTAADNFPLGFASESRKCEVYVTAFIKMAKNGWPYAYPRQQDPIDPSIGQEFKDYDPSYEYVGTYSPICAHVEPKESPIEGDSGYDPEYPLVITSGRVPYFHHGTMRHAPYIRELYPAPNVLMHPNTAAKYGLKHRDWVEISSRRGSTKGRVYENRGMHEKILWMERFWNPECYDKAQPNKTGGWAECNFNVLSKSSPPYNEVYGSYQLRGFCVNIKPTTKPENVWAEPKEFQPWMPSNANQFISEVGIAMEMDGNSPNVVFNDWDRDAATTSEGGGH